MFLAVRRVIGADAIEARLPRVGPMRTDSVDPVHYVVGRMLPTKQLLLAPCYLEDRVGRARMV